MAKQYRIEKYDNSVLKELHEVVNNLGMQTKEIEKICHNLKDRELSNRLHGCYFRLSAVMTEIIDIRNVMVRINDDLDNQENENAA